jgi:hypothetical protein
MPLLFYPSLRGDYINRHNDSLQRAVEANQLLTQMSPEAQEVNADGKLDSINDSLIISYFNMGVEHEHLLNYESAIANYSKVMELLTIANSSTDLYNKVRQSLQQCLAKKNCADQIHRQRHEVRVRHSLCEYLKKTSLIDARDINTTFYKDFHSQNSLNMGKTFTCAHKASHSRKQSNLFKKEYFLLCQ